MKGNSSRAAAAAEPEGQKQASKQRSATAAGDQNGVCSSVEQGCVAKRCAAVGGVPWWGGC